MAKRCKITLRRALSLFLPALLAIAPVAAHAGESCPAERAIYAMTADEGEFRAQFIPSAHFASGASDLYFKLTTPQRSYWFNFSASNGYGGVSLNPVSDPYAADAREDGPRNIASAPDGELDEAARQELLASLRFIALDADLAELPAPPASGGNAPPFLMLPEIGLTLWYNPGALTEDHAAERDPMPRAVFRLMECLPEAPEKAWP